MSSAILNDVSSSSCWSKVASAYGFVKEKFNNLSSEVDRLTHKHLNPGAARFIQTIVKVVPIALALLLVPHVIVAGLFTIAAVLRIIEPEVFHSHPELFGCAARVFGVYAAIHAVGSVFLLGISEAIEYLMMCGACIYVAREMDQDEAIKKRHAGIFGRSSAPPPVADSQSVQGMEVEQVSKVSSSASGQGTAPLLPGDSTASLDSVAGVSPSPVVITPLLQNGATLQDVNAALTTEEGSTTNGAVPVSAAVVSVVAPPSPGERADAAAARAAVQEI